jgi:hypothetical protein
MISDIDLLGTHVEHPGFWNYDPHISVLIVSESQKQLWPDLFLYPCLDLHRGCSNGIQPSTSESNWFDEWQIYLLQQDLLLMTTYYYLTTPHIFKLDTSIQ